MRLINTATLKLEEFITEYTPPYAILSHTWEDEEVTFEAFKAPEACRHLRGFSKIQHSCRLAREVGLNYVWVDTCCINKDSSAELSEAINSMFQWYARSIVCYVYLADLAPHGSLRGCRWFTRGWTLQELIAPRRVKLYDQGWNLYGEKDDESVCRELSLVTGIEPATLQDSAQMYFVPVGCRMSWASMRRTTRVEDLAYCLLGIFDVNMPLLYGEGEKAFVRLQEEICRGSTDMTLFAWQTNEPDHRGGIFAASPSYFVGAHQTSPVNIPGLNEEYTLTNKGLRINSIVRGDPAVGQVVPLNCFKTGSLGSLLAVGIYVRQYGPDMYVRIRLGELALGAPDRLLDLESTGDKRPIYIRAKRG